MLFGVYCYTGKQGKGKTMSACKFLIEYKLKSPSCRILTNVKSFNPFSDILYFEKFSDIMNYCIANYSKPIEKKEQIIIFYDEIFTLLEKNKSLNIDILAFLSQLRKRQIILITTAQEWLEINITFRRYIRYQIDCNMITLPISHNAICINCVNDGDLIKWDNEINEYIAPRVMTKIFKGNKSVVDSYNTFETITTNKL